MNETFWGLYDAQIDALKDCKSPDEANLIMLETAKFLVEHVDQSDSTMGMYDKFGIRKLFAAHNALGTAVTAFYDAKKDVLDPGARNGAIGQKITTLTEQISSAAAALQQLQELEKDLFAKEDALKALEKELEDWQRKVKHLRETETTAAAEIQKYKDLFKQLDAIMVSYAEEVAFWEAHLGENSEIVRCMSVYGVTSLQDLLTNINKLRDSIKYDLKALDTVIGKVVRAEETARDAILKKQNKMV